MRNHSVKQPTSLLLQLRVGGYMLTLRGAETSSAQCMFACFGVASFPFSARFAVCAMRRVLFAVPSARLRRAVAGISISLLRNDGARQNTP